MNKNFKYLLPSVMSLMLITAGCNDEEILSRASSAEQVTDKEEVNNTENSQKEASIYDDENTKYFEYRLTWGPNVDLETKVDMAARLVPTKEQLKWQSMELIAFVHFGVNTYTGLEWGDGTENPIIFNPTELDTDQWVRVLRDAGFKMVMLTAKHHDGFCLWQTKTTPHSVGRSTNWKNGKGDVLKELRKSCDKYGMELGVYVSPWDRNSPHYGYPSYDDVYEEQIRELLTNYGKIAEMWFDGANGTGVGVNDRVHKYDWNRYMNTIYKLQPHILTANMGDHIRWNGNEAGKGREQEWNATPLPPSRLTRDELLLRDYAYAAQINDPYPRIGNKWPDLGSRDRLKLARELYYYPAEADASIRNRYGGGVAWFHKNGNKINPTRSLQELKNIYFQTVGSNQVMLLNIPPGENGKFTDSDVTRLNEFGQWVRSMYSYNLVKEGEFGTEEPWVAASGESKEFDLKSGSFNVFMIQEDISKGQRVEEFKVEAYTNGQWVEISGAKGMTVGWKTMKKLASPWTAEKIRVTISKTRRTARITNIGLFYAD